MSAAGRLAAAVLAVGLLGPAAMARAADGNLYWYGSSIWAPGAQFTAVQDGETWTIGAPALASAIAGSKWEMNWGCPVGGSEIALLRWGALRTGDPSSLEQRVQTGPSVIWAEPDAAIPRSPAPGRLYEVPLPPGLCDVHLRLVQTETRAQAARTYFIDHPAMLVRDVSPPSALIRAVTGGWLNAGVNAVRIDWSASDNFGADGLGVQGISVAGIGKWAAAPGPGDFAAMLDLGGVPDGVQSVHLDVLGDGTSPGSADAWISVDRTPPVATGFALSYPGTPGLANFAWTPLDATSGVGASEVQLARATDGTESGEWVATASRLGDAAQAATAVAVTGVPDGVHAWRVITLDGAGNLGITPAPGAVLVDTTPPEVALEPIPPAWASNLGVDLVASDNLQATLGLGATEIEVNTAADGGTGGSWLTLAAERRPAGRQVFALPLAGLADGPHAVRVRVRNGGPFEGSLASERTARVNVDLTSPDVSTAAFTPSGPESLGVTFTANDPLSGVASATVQWDRDGAWETLLGTAVPAGAQSLTVDTRGVPSGDRRFRLLVADGAGNVTAVTGPPGLTVDHAAPTVTGITLTGGAQGWRLAWSQSDPIGGFGSCPTSIMVNGPGTQGVWREIATAPGIEGAQSLILPIEGLPPGAYRVRVVACDAAGGRGEAETGGLLVPVAAAAAAGPGSADGSRAGGVGSDAKDPFARLRGARLQLRVASARTERFHGRPTLVRRLTYGRRVAISGRLTAADGGAIRGAEIQVRGHADRVLARTLTRRDGRFAVSARPEASGALRIGVPAGRALLPARRPVDVRVVVRPTVTLSASRTRAAFAGAPVVFSGRVMPAPALLGGSTHKGIVLEWRDPLRGVWRPVLNARVRRDGHFRLAWRFGVRNLRIPMRVRVPAERGWPLQPVLTKPITITVR